MGLAGAGPGPWAGESPDDLRHGVPDDLRPQGQGLPWGGDISQDLKDEHEAMTTRLEQLVHEAQGAQRKAWTEWASRAMDQGAGRAHRFTKEPKPWKPTTVLVEGDRVSSDLQLLLAGLGIQWAEIWRAEIVKEGDPVLEDLLVSEHCGRGPPLDRAPPAEFRAISRSYKAKSATSLDGFHMRHYSMLCDDALLTLGILFQCMESHGYPPFAAAQCGCGTAGEASRGLQAHRGLQLFLPALGQA